MRTATIDDMIESAGWFPGSVDDWSRLHNNDRKRLAFAGCGCAIAYPTWHRPVDCVHTECQILRGEIKPLVMTNRVLRAEIDGGWLRFDKESRAGRVRLAKLVRAVRCQAIATGVYNPWDMPGGWMAIVGSSIVS